MIATILAVLVLSQPVSPAPAKEQPVTTPPSAPTAVPDARPAEPTTAAPVKAPKVEIAVNSEEAPDLKEWGEKVKKVCEEYFPKMVEQLDSEGFRPREKVTFVFKKAYNVPAATTGGTININAEHVRKHPDDIGMMIHEMAHVVQAYPRQKANLGWLVEGIADHVRFWRFEPQVKQRQIDVKKASYKDAYRTTAAFLGWMEKYDTEIVKKLNAKLRKGGADESVFKELTGKTVEELWKEFIEAGAPSSPVVKKEEKKDEKKEEIKPHSEPRP